MVAKKQRPLAGLRDIRRLGHDVSDRKTIFLAQSHINARHQREVKRHVKFVALSEIGTHVGRPLIGFRQHHPSRKVLIDFAAEILYDLVSLGKVLAVRSFAFHKIRDGVYTERIDAHVEPIAHDLQNFVDDHGIVVVQVRLVRKESVPEIRLPDWIPGPIGFFGIGENDPDVAILLVAVVPHVEFALGRAWRRLASGLKPGMLIGRVVHHELDHYLQPALVGRRKKLLKILDRAIAGMHVEIVGNVITVVAEWRREKGQQPKTCDTEVLEIVEFLNQPAKIADSITIAVSERAHVDLVDDGVFVPERIWGAAGPFHNRAPKRVTIRHRVPRASASRWPTGEVSCSMKRAFHG